MKRLPKDSRPRRSLVEILAPHAGEIIRAFNGTLRACYPYVRLWVLFQVATRLMETGQLDALRDVLPSPA